MKTSRLRTLLTAGLLSMATAITMTACGGGGGGGGGDSSSTTNTSSATGVAPDSLPVGCTLTIAIPSGVPGFSSSQNFVIQGDSSAYRTDVIGSYTNTTNGGSYVYKKTGSNTASFYFNKVDAAGAVVTDGFNRYIFSCTLNFSNSTSGTAENCKDTINYQEYSYGTCTFTISQ